MSLLSLATVKQFLRIAHANEDAALQILLDSAEEWVADSAGMELCASGATAYTTVTEDIDGGELYLWPAKLPIRMIVSIKDMNDGQAVMAATEYALSEFLTRIERWSDDSEDGTLRTWDAGRKRYRVEYTAGMKAADLPAQFKNAVMQYVYREYHARDEKQIGRFAGKTNAEQDAVMNSMILSFSLRRVMS